ncbi:MAG: flagellar basal-body MS-ring/collar protein FliF [Polyangiaceae bacterium]
MSDPKKPGPPSLFTKALERVKRIPRPLLVLIGTTLLAGIGLAIWLAVRAANEPYAVLFSNLSQDDAAAVVAKLKEMKVPHRVTEGGRIEVPEARVHELRLEVAGAGLPRGGGVGFESFDKMRLGATEFEQKVMFKRALEGELTRTVSSIDGVESVRVHLVLPEKSVFSKAREPGSASVVLKLKPGRELEQHDIGAVVHLVASAVPGLSADRVTLVTTDGVLLRKPRVSADGSASAEDSSDDAQERLKQTSELESRLEERAREILERAVGAGHVDVKVSAELDFSAVERTEDRFHPKQTGILRSEEQTIERQGGAIDDTVAGVPGAESNLPTGTDDEEETGDTATPTKSGGLVREQHTRNFEVDRVTEKRSSRGAFVKRLAVAVIVDGVPAEDGSETTVARSPEELAKLEALVRGVVGIDDERKDLISVQSIPFSLNPTEVAAAPDESSAETPAAAEPKKDLRRSPILIGAGAGGLVLLLLFAILLKRRRARRRAAEEEKARALALAEAKAAELLPEKIDYRAEALRRAEEDPATAALILRAWLNAHAELEAPKAA